MSWKSTLENVPWFAVAGVLVIINMVMLRASMDFSSIVAPTYLTQALLYLVLGYAFLRGHQGNGFVTFLMAGVWLLTSILVWNNVVNAAVLWLLLIAQAALTFMFFTGYRLPFAESGSTLWSHAAVWLVFLFGISKFLLVLANNTLAQMPLWGLGILLISFGYIIRPVEKEWAMPLQAVGCLVAAVAALTLTTPGLQLLP